MFESHVDFGFPNWLAKEHRVTVTRTGTKNGTYVKDVNGKKIAQSGAPYPANDSTAIGLIVEAVDVTDGTAPIAVMVEGYVHEERLPVVITEEAKGAMKEIKYEKYNATEV